MINMNSISQQLKYEEWAFSHGYNSETQIALAADFLNGLRSSIGKEENLFNNLPKGIHVSKPLREAFYNAGKELAELKHNYSERDVNESLSDIFHKFSEEIKKTNSILASTGDCRGACAYNTGDRSEYLNYGW